MHFKKAIALVALAAATAAPSALALHPPIDASDPGTKILVRESGVHPKTKPQHVCGQRRLQVRPNCFTPGV